MSAGENQFLQFHREKIVQLLKHEEFLVRLVSRNIEDRHLDFESIFSRYVLHLQTSEFLRLVSEAKFKPAIDLAETIKNTWSEFREDLKEQTNQTFGILYQTLINRTNPNFEYFDAVHTHIKINTISGFQDVIEYDGELDFLELIKNQNERILFMGEAGIGKTFHFKNVLYSWANDRTCLSDYALLHLKLDEVAKDSDFEQEIFDQNFPVKKFVTKQLLSYYMSTDCDDVERKVILCFDDADENIHSVINNILTKRDHFNCFPIIVWSRTWKAQEIKGTFDFLFQLDGFDDSFQEKFFQKFFQENHEEESIKISGNVEQVCQTPKKLKRSRQIMNFLRKSSEFSTLKRNPLICYLLAYLWEKKKFDSMHSTALILQSFMNLTVKKKIQTEYERSNKEIYFKLEILAFENLLKNVSINSSKELEEFGIFGSILVPLKKKLDRNWNLNSFI